MGVGVLVSGVQNESQKVKNPSQLSSVSVSQAYLHAAGEGRWVIAHWLTEYTITNSGLSYCILFCAHIWYGIPIMAHNGALHFFRIIF